MICRAVCRWPRLAILLIVVWSGREILVAQETVTIPRKQFEELTAKASEADRLAAEVAALKQQLQQLQNASASPNTTGDLSSAPQQIPTAPPVTAPNRVGGSPPISRPRLPGPAEWPALDAKSVIPMAELLMHYSANPLAADDRYKGHRLTLRGSITGFDKPLFLSYYHVIFRDSGLSARASFRIYPPDRFKRVYVTAVGDQMVGEAPGFAPAILAKADTEVVIEGKCAGVRNGVVSFVEAQIINTPAGSGPK